MFMKTKKSWPTMTVSANMWFEEALKLNVK